jgi:hypothetical protein
MLWSSGVSLLARTSPDRSGVSMLESTLVNPSSPLRPNLRKVLLPLRTAPLPTVRHPKDRRASARSGVPCLSPTANTPDPSDPNQPFANYITFVPLISHLEPSSPAYPPAVSTFSHTTERNTNQSMEWTPSSSRRGTTTTYPSARRRTSRGTGIGCLIMSYGKGRGRVEGRMRRGG